MNGTEPLVTFERSFRDRFAISLKRQVLVDLPRSRLEAWAKARKLFSAAEDER